MLAGWILVVAAIILLPSAAARNSFVAAGFAVEILGLILFARSHIAIRREREP